MWSLGLLLLAFIYLLQVCLSLLFRTRWWLLACVKMCLLLLLQALELDLTSFRLDCLPLKPELLDSFFLLSPLRILALAY